MAAFVTLAACATVVSCSRCEGSTQRGEVDTAPSLVWERAPLGQSKSALEAAAPDFVTFKNGETWQCGQSIELPVANVEEKRIEVRFATGHALEHCTSQGVLSRDASTPVRLRADFVDGLLARLEVALPQEKMGSLSDEISTRLGAPEKVLLAQDDLLADPVEYLCWYPQEDVIWTLASTHTRGGVFALQHLPLSRKLLPPGAATKRGTPVSLDDLGFGSNDVDSAFLEELVRDSDQGRP